MYNTTIHQFLDNPMGKGSSAIAARSAVKGIMESRYLALLERKPKLFKEKVYVDKNNEYYLHVTIPSETERDNTYDIVIKLKKPEEGTELADNSRTLNDYNIEVFSNSPSFVYTYAYTFNDYGILIPFLKDKYREVVLQDNPIIRNPAQNLSYEKSITFAMFHILTKRLTMRSVLEEKAEKLDLEKFIKTIRNDDTIKMEINKANRKVKSKEEEKKASVKTASKRASNDKVRKPTSSSSKVRSAKPNKAKITSKPKR